MNKEVLLTISGLQADAYEKTNYADAPIAITTAASYYSQNGKHFILFEEIDEDTGAITKNRLKIGGSSMELTKTGYVNSQLVFEENTTTISYYETPFGRLSLGIESGNFYIEESEHALDVALKYTLHVNSEPIVQCDLTVNVQSN